MHQRPSKAKRHAKILEIIRGKPIETQEELALLLHEEGFEVTQATVSRDIKELGITKTPTGRGSYRYFVPQERSFEDSSRRMRRLFQDAVISLDYSENLVVIRTLTGNAHAVAATIDEAGGCSYINNNPVFYIDPKYRKGFMKLLPASTYVGAFSF
jgi:transcriptional regulator of arginine metabolism